MIEPTDRRASPDPSNVVTQELRLAAGDWVRARDASTRAVGKLIEGDYDPADDALRAGLVEAEGCERWFPAGELVRVQPNEEARLCEAARAKGLLGDEIATSLLARVDRLRDGALAFIRTPGLLDGLWALSSRADPDHGSAAITAFLDEGALVLASRPASAPAVSEPPALPTSPAADVTTPRPVSRWVRQRRAHLARCQRALDRAPSAAVELARKAVEADLQEAVLAREEEDDRFALVMIAAGGRVLERILGSIGRSSLARMFDALGLIVPRLQDLTAEDLVQRILAADPPVEDVVGTLGDEELREACRAVGLRVVDGDLDVLRVRLVAHADPSVDPLWFRF